MSVIEDKIKKDQGARPLDLSEGEKHMKTHEKWLLKGFVCIIGIIVALLSVLWLPKLAETTAQNNPELAYLRYPVLITMIVTTIPFFLALFKANQLLNLIQNKEAFTEASVKALKVISYCGMAIAISYTGMTAGLILVGAMHPGIFIAFVMLVVTSLTISFFANLLKILLEEALSYKNEVDLTV